MPFTFTEFPDSRAQSSGSANSASHTLKYKAVGDQNDYNVHAYAILNTPLYVVRPSGTLFRNNIQITPDGWQQYWVEVTYGKLDKGTLQANSYTFNFDTTGGTAHIDRAIAHVATFPGSEQHHDGFIAVNEDGSVDGCDIVIPSLKFNFAFKFAQGYVTIGYVKNLAAITGCTNSSKFLGFNPGELLFMGASGSDGSSLEMEITYSFEASSNLTGITRGSISSINKKGFEYLWDEKKDDVVSGAAVKRAKAVHVEQVYYSADLGSVFGWNIYTGG